jgi:hypothetical protein
MHIGTTTESWKMFTGVIAYMVVMSLFFGAFSVDKSISNQWSDYSYGSLENRVANMNLPLEHDSAMIFRSRDTGTIVPLENYHETCNFDDIGYMLFGQLFVKVSGIRMDGDKLAQIHNFLFVAGVIMLTVELVWFFRSYLVGILLFPLLLFFHNGIKPLIYSSVSQHTLLSVLPVLFIIVMLPVLKLRKSAEYKFYLAIFLAGIISGIFLLIRNPFGKASLIILTLIALSATGIANWKKTTASLILLMTGFFLAVVCFTGAIAYIRDMEQGWNNREFIDYIKMPSQHTTYFTLMAAIGRYENPLELKYSDGALDRYLSKKMEEDKLARNRTEYKYQFDKLARKEFYRYLKKYPGEYVAYLLKGVSEMVWVIPAISFQHGDIYYGVPEAVKPLASKIDTRDTIPELNGGLLNIRLKYIDLRWYQWSLYIASLILIVATLLKVIKKSWSQPGRTSDSLYLFIFLFLMGGVLCIPRALVPVWGQDFVIFYWLFAFVCIFYLFAGGQKNTSRVQKLFKCT